MKNYDLLSISTRAPKDMKKDETKKKTKELVDELTELQTIMFAEDKWKLLIVLQGMDASGKDSTIKQVFSAVNPQGVKVHSFKKPTEEELAHDFLWRVHKHTPRSGMIQIYNRSHYEDVLVTRVMGMIDDDIAMRRFEYINCFEQLLQDHGTIILKFYLHISEERQKEKFEKRMVNRRKNWKFNPDDLETAKKWPEYRKVYQDVFNHCSPEIPWIIVPADQKWYKEYIIAKTIVEKLKGLNMKYPTLNQVLNED